MTRKRDYYTAPYLYVCPNDKVEIYFDHSDTLVIAKIIRVDDRPGRVNNGKTKILPLVSYVPIETLKEGKKVSSFDYPDETEKSCDISYIRKIIERGKNKHLVRRTFLYPHEVNVSNISSNRVIHTTFISMLICVWLRVVGPTTYLDYEKAWSEFEKHKMPGVTCKQSKSSVEFPEREFRIFYFRKKTFEKWVRRDYMRMLKKHSVLEEEETRFITEWEEQLWEEYEEEAMKHVLF